MNFKYMLKILGLLTVVLAVAMLLPLIVAVVSNSPSLHAFVITTCLTLGIGLVFGNLKPANTGFQVKESLLVVAGGWVLFSLLGALPYVFGAGMSYTDAVFETMSGLTTTGASVIDNLPEIDRAMLFWRSLTHWVGGMGIIVLSLAIMPLLGSKGMNLFRAEVPGPTKDKLLPRLQETAKLLWIVYVVFTGVQVFLLKFFGMSWFDSICHAFATMATGGFSNHGESIAGYNNPAVEWVIIVFMFIAGANFALHFRLFSAKSLRGYFRDIEFKYYFLITFVAFGVVFMSLVFGGMLDFEKAARDGLFQVVSITTTTGFVSADYSRWPALAQMVIFSLMLVGGCGGSTGGGVKVIRLLILLKTSFSEIRKVLHTRAVFHTKLGGVPIPEDVQSKVLAFIVLYAVSILAGGAFLTLYGVDLATALSASVACIGNIGPGFAGVSPVNTFAALPDGAKWFLTGLMLVGRLELFTVLVLFSREFWRR